MIGRFARLRPQHCEVSHETLDFDIKAGPQTVECETLVYMFGFCWLLCVLDTFSILGEQLCSGGGEEASVCKSNQHQPVI